MRRLRQLMVCLGVAAWGLLGFASIQAQTPGRPDIELFFRKPAVHGVRLSPNGRRVALLAPGPKGRVLLGIADLEHWDRLRFVAGFADVDVHSLQWVNDERLVFDVIDLQHGIDEQDGPGLWAVNADGSDLRKLVNPRTDFVREGSAVASRTLEWNHSLLRTLRDGSADIVVLRHGVGSDELRSNFPLRLNTLTGIAKPLVDRVPVDRARDWLVDPLGVARVVQADEGEGSVVYWRADERSPWQEIHRSKNRYLSSLQLKAVSRNGEIFVLWATPGEAQYLALYRYSPEARKVEDQPLVSIEGFDFTGSLVFDGDGKRLLGLHFVSDAASSLWLDPGLAEVQKQVDAAMPNTINRLTCSSCDKARYFVVESGADRVPPYYSVYDRETRKILPVGSSRPWLENLPMAVQDFVRVKARDGLELPTYLTKPAGKGPWPAVVMVHGGPFVRGREWAWNAESQFLASRGYLVIETEFRGSEGFGQRHLKAGFKQWGLKMQDDVTDATEWAIAKGLAQRDRICIAGASYGGYATLMGLLRYPDLYRCGVEWVGVTDIDLMYSINWSDLSQSWRRYGMPALVGDREKDAEQLKATSPLQQADRIRQPILMAYGGADRRVPIEHGRKFRSAVERNNKSVEWVEYPAEGHGWLTTANDVDFWGRVERFLDRNIGAGASARP